MKTIAAFSVIFLAASGLAAHAAAPVNAAGQPGRAITATPEPSRSHTSERIVSKILPGRYARQCGGPQAPFVVSPDGLHVAYIAGFGKEKELVCESAENWGADGWLQHFPIVDGKKWKHEGLDAVFSPDSKHVISKAPGTVVLDDGREMKVGSDNLCDAEFKFSPDSKQFICGSYRFHVPPLEGEPIAVRKYGTADTLVFSPDSQRLAYVANDSGGYHVVVDEQEGKPYSGVGKPVFSPDSKRVAYFVYDETRDKGVRTIRRFMVIDRQEGEPFAGISDQFTFSLDSQHALYVASTDQGRVVVVDGKPGKAYSASIISPAFSPDSQHVAYIVAPDHGEAFPVLDGQEGKHYSAKSASLSNLRFRADGKLTYTVRAGDTVTVVVDGTEQTPYKDAFGDGPYLFSWSPDGQSLAFVANSKTDRKWHVILNGKAGKPYDTVADLVFSPDGKSLAYAAYKKDEGKWRIVVNGHEGKAYDYILVNRELFVTNESTPYESVETNSLHFDSPDKLHYLAVRGQNIVLVEERLSE